MTNSNWKLEEVQRVYESLRECLRDGSHTCGGSCFALRAPHYSYNGGPYTPERKLAAEAAAGCELASKALNELNRMAEEEAAKDYELFIEGLKLLRDRRSGVLFQSSADGSYYVEDDADDRHDYRDPIVTNYGSDYSRKMLTQYRLSRTQTAKIQCDHSGVGNCWRTIDVSDLPATIAEEIAAEILDGGREACELYVATNGRKYRWSHE